MPELRLPVSENCSANNVEKKKKNAEAQAAFRARRANYIATLEEAGSLHLLPQLFLTYVVRRRPVTSLESVVRAIKEAIQESRMEVWNLQEQNVHLCLEFHQREMYFRAVCQSEKPGDDPPQLPSAIFLQFNTTGTPVGQSTFQYQGDQFNHNYRSPDSFPIVLGGSASEHSCTGPLSIPLANHASGSKIQQLSYPLQRHPTSTGDPQWPLQPIPARSPSPKRQQVALQAILETAPYSFSNGPLPVSRVPSPSSTPHTSLFTISPSLQYNFWDTMVQSTERQDFDCRQHSMSHGEVTLHGGTTDVPSLSGLHSDTVGHRLNSQELEPRTEQQHSTPLVGTSTCHLGGTGQKGSSSHHDLTGSDELSAASRKRKRQGTHTLSQSPFPGIPSLQDSVAVIKAQAFGALRRPRASCKKSKLEPAAEATVAANMMDIPEAQGIGIGIRDPEF
jgi:hypothetical protein